MSAINLLGVPRTILFGGAIAVLLGGAIAVLAAATALTLNITQPKLAKITLPRAAVAASAQPLDPAILHGTLQKLRSEGALP
jgi:hypothetical protein